MVVIRLSRTGATKRPFYHVVATDSRKARNSGCFIERLGYFNPLARGEEVKLHLEKERVDYWVNTGAQASERVLFLLQEFAKSPDQHQQSLDAQKHKRVATLKHLEEIKAVRAATAATAKPKPVKKPVGKHKKSHGSHGRKAGHGQGKED